MPASGFSLIVPDEVLTIFKDCLRIFDNFLMGFPGLFTIPGDCFYDLLLSPPQTSASQAISLIRDDTVFLQDYSGATSKLQVGKLDI